MSEIINSWAQPQQRLEMKPYSILRALDPDEQQTLDDFLKAPVVEVNYDLDDDRDYAVHFQTEQGLKIARISDFVTINGVRWNIFPGKNLLPKPVYEFLMNCPEQKRLLSCPEPGKPQNLMGGNRLFSRNV